MSIVVSDTSPVRALANLNLLELLHQIYGEVIVPHGVAVELRDPPEGEPAIDLSRYSFVTIRTVSESSRLESLMLDLDQGESAALALAIEIRADLILIDELASCGSDA